MDQILAFVKLFLVYFIFTNLLGCISYPKGERFVPSIVLLLIFLSVYALVRTSGQTFLLVPLFIILIYIHRNKPHVTFKGIDLLNLLPSLFIWGIYFSTYFAFNNFSLGVAHEDYIIYSRIAHYNDFFGTENTKTFYNILNPDIKNEIYHFTELWAMAFFRWLNGQTLLMNFFFLVCPLVTYLIYLGFLEIRLTSKRRYAFLATLLVLFIVFPYDLLPKLGSVQLPIVGIGMTIFSLKNLMVVPVILLIIKGFESRSLDYSAISLATFLYPLVMPVILGALIFYILLFEKEKLKKIIWPLSISIYFVVYSLIIGTSGLGFSLYGLTDFSLLAKTAWIALFLPVIFTGFSLFSLWECGHLRKEFIYFIGLVLWIASALWILFAANIDANQFFRNSFHAIFVMVISLHFVLLVQKRRLKQVAVMAIVYLIPFVFVYGKHGFIKNPDKEVLSMLQHLPQHAKVLVLPEGIENPSIYQYNEPMYIPFNSIFMVREDLHLINITAALPKSPKINSLQAEEMLKIYQRNSPYFQACGYLDGGFECLISFMKANNIQYLISKGVLEKPF